MFIHTCCCIFILWWLGLIKISKEIKLDLNLDLKMCSRKRKWIFFFLFVLPLTDYGPLGLVFPAQPSAPHRTISPSRSGSPLPFPFFRGPCKQAGPASSTGAAPLSSLADTTALRPMSLQTELACRHNLPPHACPRTGLCSDRSPPPPWFCGVLAWPTHWGPLK